jgi:hypothetical protein
MIRRVDSRLDELAVMQFQALPVRMTLEICDLSLNKFPAAVRVAVGRIIRTNCYCFNHIEESSFLKPPSSIAIRFELF